MSGAPAEALPAAAPRRAGRAARGGWAALPRLVLRRRGSAVGLALVAAMLLTALAAPLLAPADPNDGEIIQRLRPPAWLAPNGLGLMGTDQLGRDLFSRVVYGSRVSLLIGASAVVLAGGLGLLLGLVAGYVGHLADGVIMRLTDIQMAFPFILLALSIIAILGPGIPNLIAVFAVTGWPAYARIIRGSVLSVREKEFVEAARALGGSRPRIILRHILPNVLSPLIVISSFEMARVIISEASLSFLGLGVPAAIPSWGQMLAEGREQLQIAWWTATFPGLALMLLVMGINFIGDGLRDALDPRLRNY